MLDGRRGRKALKAGASAAAAKEEDAVEGAKEGAATQPSTAEASSHRPVPLEGSVIPRYQADIASKAMEAQEAADRLAIWLKVPRAGES